MSNPQRPKPAKLVVGVFMKEKDLVRHVALQLTREFGPLDMVSAWLPFDYTSYYETEMGSPLFRRLFTFKALAAQGALAEIKIITNTIENEYLRNGQRRINIDPGYLVLERFVLATGKNFTHRIYLDKGIYADLTLIYQKGAFQKLPWTYPDYADRPIRDYLERVRNRYIEDLKRES